MRKSWTEQKIAAELSAVIAVDGMMPSNNRLKQLGRSDLANQVSRRGGFLDWAKRLGAQRGQSDSDTGWDGEIALAGKLTIRGYTVERMQAVKAPYDLKVNGALRIDVKSANYAEYGACKGWFYRVGKEAQADVLALYQLDTGVVYFLPWNICPVSNVTISRSGGKWSDFKDRYDLIGQLSKQRESEREIWPSV